MVWNTNSEHSVSLWAYHASAQSDERVSRCLEWLNVLWSDHTLNLHNFATI